MHTDETNSHNEQPAKRPPCKELASIFPEAKEVVPELIKETVEKRRNLAQNIGDDLAIIDASSDDEDTQYFWHEWVRLNKGAGLQELDKQLSHLRCLQNTIDNKPTSSGLLPDELIDAARNIPVTDVVGEPTLGNRCICPLHDDHHPSMQLYMKDNRAWCFACQKGGDPIQLQILISDCDFRTAVLELTGGSL